MATKPIVNGSTRVARPLLVLLVGIIILLAIVVGMVCWWHRGWQIAACTPANLKLAAGQQSGAAGTIYQHITLTNTGTNSCTMSGFPTAFLYGSNGYALGNSAAARPNPVPVAITLGPNETANTVLGYPQAGNFDPGVCTAQSTVLKLYPPSATTPL